MGGGAGNGPLEEDAAGIRDVGRGSMGAAGAKQGSRGESGAVWRVCPGKVWVAKCSCITPSPQKDTWIKNSLNLTRPGTVKIK